MIYITADNLNYIIIKLYQLAESNNYKEVIRMNTAKINPGNEFFIDLNDTVYEITLKYPEVVHIMKEIGFKSITEKGMIQTAGRFMSILKGAKLKNIPIENIVEAFESKGYKVKYREE